MKKFNKGIVVSFLFLQAIFAHDDDYQQIQDVISAQNSLLYKKAKSLDREFRDIYYGRSINWEAVITDVGSLLGSLKSHMDTISRFPYFKEIKDLSYDRRYKFNEVIESCAIILGEKYPDLKSELLSSNYVEDLLKKHQLIKDVIADLESLKTDKGWSPLDFSLSEETIDAVFNMCETLLKKGLIDIEKRDKIFEMRPITVGFCKEHKKRRSMTKYFEKAEDMLVQLQLSHQPTVLSLVEKENLLKKFLSNSWSEEAIEQLFMMSKNHDFLIDDVLRDALSIEAQNPGVDINVSHLPAYVVQTLSLPEQRPAIGRVYALSVGHTGGAIHKVVSMLSTSDDGGIIGQLGETAQGSWRVASQLVNFDCKKILTHQTQILDKADGPSAGIAYFASLYSAKNQIALPSGLALTGALDLDGSINPVGGIAQKILATKFFGLSTLIASEGNRADIEALPLSYTHGLSIHYVYETENLILLLDQLGVRK